jgi:hypothetical protein
MSDKKYLFNGKDISINVYVQIRTVVNVIMERTQKTFMEAVEIFYDSETYKQLQHTENGFWAESPDYIADEFFRERMIAVEIRKAIIWKRFYIMEVV